MKALDNENFLKWCCFGNSDHGKRLVEPDDRVMYF